MNHPSATTLTLANLNDTGLELADDRQDIRGHKVIDRNGEEIGHVSDLFIDADERKVRVLEIRIGGFLGLGARHVLLPVDAVTRVTDAAVHVNTTGAHIAGSPGYDPAIVKAPVTADWEPFYGYYGLSPYWGNAYRYPEFPIVREDMQSIDRDGHMPRE